MKYTLLGLICLISFEAQALEYEIQFENEIDVFKIPKKFVLLQG